MTGIGVFSAISPLLPRWHCRDPERSLEMPTSRRAPRRRGTTRPSLEHIYSRTNTRVRGRHFVMYWELDSQNRGFPGLTKWRTGKWVGRLKNIFTRPIGAALALRPEWLGLWRIMNARVLLPGPTTGPWLWGPSSGLDTLVPLSPIAPSGLVWGVMWTPLSCTWPDYGAYGSWARQRGPPIVLPYHGAHARAYRPACPWVESGVLFALFLGSADFGVGGFLT